MSLQRLAAGLGAAGLLAVAGCGGSSVESKVSDRVGEKVTDCRAAGITDLGKIYSCQTGNSTVCVMVDGDDVFYATDKARAAGISC